MSIPRAVSRQAPLEVRCVPRACIFRRSARARGADLFDGRKTAARNRALMDETSFQPREAILLPSYFPSPLSLRR